jgi:hypothetical protein
VLVPVQPSCLEMTMAEQGAVSKKHKDAPPEVSEESWWAEIARRVGRASRALAEGAEGFADAFDTDSKAASRTTATPDLNAALLQLHDHLARFGRDRMAALAEDEEFWTLLGQVERLHRQTHHQHPRASKCAPEPMKSSS